MTPKTLRTAILVGIAFFLIGLFRLNDLSLYTDSTRYLIWGNSLASLQGWVDTTQPVSSSFVMNAPLYPLLLAPILVVFPLSLTAAKVWTLLWGTGALILFFILLRRHFGELTALAATIVLALNPLFLVASTEVLSEAPFIAISILAMLAFESYLKDPRDKTAQWVLFGSLAIITLLREVGAAFVLAGLIMFFRKKDLRSLLITGGSAGLLFLLWTIRNSVIGGGGIDGQSNNLQYITQHFVTEANESLTAEFLVRAWLNLKGYVVGIGGMVFFPFPENLIGTPSPLFSSIQSLLQSGRVVLFGIVGITAVYGVRLDARESAAGWFRALSLGIFVAIVLVYPVHDIRFLLPLVPLILFFTVKALSEIGEGVQSKTALRAVAVLLVVLAAFPNALAVAEILRTNAAYRANPGEYFLSAEKAPARSFFGQPWRLLGDWIMANTTPEAVLASPAKDIATFVGSRKVLETSRVLPTPIFERILRDNDARYLITTKVQGDFETFQVAMQESRRFWFSPVGTFGQLILYKVHSSILEGPPPYAPSTIDTTSAEGLLLSGRKALQQLAYRDALDRLSRAQIMEPNQPETYFQLLTVFSMVGDSSAALQVYETLFTIPQSTAYTQIAQTLLGTMNTMLNASRLTNPVQFGFAAFEGGLSYWSLGFPAMALEVMTNIVNADTTNFVGSLWGIHIAKQVGDTLLSNRFLRRLKTIDITAQIVGDWDAVRKMEESLKTARSAQDRITLYSGIAKVYVKIELFDEAIDVLERALALNPADIDVLLLRAEVFEKKRARWGAARAYSEILRLEPHNSYAKERLDSLKIDL